MSFDPDAAHRACMSNTFSPRTEGPVGKAAARSQTYAANLTIPLILNAGSDMQYNQQPTTGHEHQHEGGDSSAQAPALHNLRQRSCSSNMMVALATAQVFDVEKIEAALLAAHGRKHGGHAASSANDFLAPH